MNIELNIINKTAVVIPTKNKFKQAILAILEDKKIKNDIIVGLKIVGKVEMKKINCKFRKIDKPTDVLSFPIYEVTPKVIDHALLLGDIVICPASAQDDILFLTQHGLKHLLGFHHK